LSSGENFVCPAIINTVQLVQLSDISLGHQISAFCSDLGNCHSITPTLSLEAHFGPDGDSTLKLQNQDFYQHLKHSSIK